MQIIDRGAVMVEDEDLEIQPKMLWLLLGISLVSGLIIGGCLATIMIQSEYLDHAKRVQDYIDSKCICQNYNQTTVPLDTELNFSLNVLS